MDMIVYDSGYASDMIIWPVLVEEAVEGRPVPDKLPALVQVC